MKKYLLSGILLVFLLPLMTMGQPQTYSVNITKFSSDKFDEFSPVYYKNGLVFCTNGNKNLVSNYLNSDNKGLSKIIFVDISPLSGSDRPKIFSSDLKTRFNDGPASFTRDGDTIYFSRNLKVDGTVSELSNPRNKLGIFMAVHENNRWTKIADLRFNNEYYNITTPSISPDGKRLFFASDNPDGYGGSDIYYCDWSGDFWNDPVNMGPGINTPGNESYPFVDREGALYFSSDGHSGLGGKDIYYTKQSGGKWLKPIPLDPPINSKFDDFALVSDSAMNSGYFSSNRAGTVDIYSFKTNIHQLFYCDKERVNNYCFKFTDETNIPIDERFLQLVWDFGDGKKATGSVNEHCFSGPGKYTVRLDAVDKKTGEVFISKLHFNLELRDAEQPIIKSVPSAIKGEPVNFDGLSSYFPGSEVLVYTWYFGDGSRTTGDKVAHAFKDQGDYEVKLGLILRNQNTGVIKNVCASRTINVFDSKSQKTTFDQKGDPPLQPGNIFDYDLAKISDLYSLEKEYNQDMVFQVEVSASRIKLGTDNKLFAKIPTIYRLKEIYHPQENVYSYVIDEESTLMATYPAFNEIKSLGYDKTRIRTYTLTDQTAKDLNNLKKVFGLSADLFFRKADYRLTPLGTQFLDLVLGYMVRYPDIKLEIDNHTDNIGTDASNLLLSQKRSTTMVDYLVANGINASRLTAKGYGESRPIASNFVEADRKLNRRIDLVIVN
jgi:outer membrane protein OmpA-like peptidoglycan-associated protein